MRLFGLKSRSGRLLFAFAVIWLAGTSLWLWEYKYAELFEKRTYIYDPWALLAANASLAADALAENTLAVKLEDKDAVVEIDASSRSEFDESRYSNFRANGYEPCYLRGHCPSTETVDLFVPVKCDPEIFGTDGNHLDCYFPILKNGKVVSGLDLSGTEAAFASDAMLHTAEKERTESIRSQIERWAPLHLAWLFGPIFGLFLVLRIGRWVLAAPEATTNA